MARPQIEIDWEQFGKLCEIQCTEEEIAFWFRCSVDTITRAVRRKFQCDFAEIREQKGCRGKIAIRRELFQIALKGNLGALIWLSKQHLGMSEKIDQSSDNRHLIAQAKEISKLPKPEILKIAESEIKRLKSEAKDE